MGFQISKHEKRIELYLAGRPALQGSAFLDENCDAHHGAERVFDLLTGVTTFVPFVCDGDEFLLVQIAAVQKAVVDTEYELASLRSYGLSMITAREVVVTMTDGTEERGNLLIEPREGSSSVQDEVNRSKGFLLLECGASVHILGLRYVATIREIQLDDGAPMEES